MLQNSRFKAISYFYPGHWCLKGIRAAVCRVALIGENCIICLHRKRWPPVKLASLLIQLKMCCSYRE
ncbi:hypothetical protein GDO81_006984 [Engystomops pustulosus]|uniref:Uncharacterized protein n=1 Tax=Engystomops pustulosus TaxID=76066 RepID=A0AAV7D0Q3_ENGPU|nr:hypothetical protein GDO81_006984 [Engystomops pustulosus]